MSKPSQIWPGDTMRRFFREIFSADQAVDAETSERLAEECTRRINRMMVWNTPKAATSKRKTTAKKPPSTPDAPASTFDPYAFSAVVVFARAGREALLERLAEIDNIADLRQLAEAQHLAIEKSLVELEQIRTAIVAGVEQRLADRRAAAS